MKHMKGNNNSPLTSRTRNKHNKIHFDSVEYTTVLSIQVTSNN